MEEKKKKLIGQQGELMRALDITTDDLIANDDGYISPEQIESVVKRQAYQYQPTIIMVSIFTVFAVLLPLIVFLTGKSADKLGFVFILSAFFLLVAVIISSYSLWQRQTLMKELEQNSIETTQGIAVVNMNLGEATLEINGMKLNASPDVLRRVRHLDPYIIHYLPKSKVILSMEHIAEQSNIRDNAAQSRLQADDFGIDYEADVLQSTSSRQEWT